MNQEQKDAISSQLLVSMLDKLEPSARERVLKAFDRATNVETLDTWIASQGANGSHRTRRNQDPTARDTWVCSFVDKDNDSGWAFYGGTPDEARAKAAAWVLSGGPIPGAHT